MRVSGRALRSVYSRGMWVDAITTEIDGIGPEKMSPQSSSLLSDSANVLLLIAGVVSGESIARGRCVKTYRIERTQEGGKQNSYSDRIYRKHYITYLTEFLSRNGSHTTYREGAKCNVRKRYGWTFTYCLPVVIPTVGTTCLTTQIEI